MEWQRVETVGQESRAYALDGKPRGEWWYPYLSVRSFEQQQKAQAAVVVVYANAHCALSGSLCIYTMRYLVRRVDLRATAAAALPALIFVEVGG